MRTVTAARILVFAFFLDLVMGDPRWLPHPVRIMGRAIEGGERFFRRRYRTPDEERRAGILLVIMILVPVFFVTVGIQAGILYISRTVSTLVGAVFFVFLVSTTIAVRGLISSARLVMKSVREGSLVEARQELSMIVGRDTDKLSEKEILRAVMETVAENLSDGVVAPVFYFVLGGLPLAMTYKAVNTLDSMVGYKNLTYINFGRAAARLDDAANYVPARITGMLIVFSVVIVGLFRRSKRTLRAAGRSLTIMRRDGRNHTSPNSGVPEAAMAGALGIRMGGPSTYGGTLVEKPYIGENEEEDYLSASCDALALAYATSASAVGFAAIFLSLKGGF